MKFKFHPEALTEYEDAARYHHSAVIPRIRMATPQDIIKAMVASLHQRHLKPLGFRKSGTTRIRPVEWKHVMNVQLSKWNSSEEAQFTLNLGISIEPLHGAGILPAA